MIDYIEFHFIQRKFQMISYIFVSRVNALSVVGYGNSQKEIVAQLLDSFIPNLSEDEQKRISDLEDIYRSKDQKNLLKKRTDN